MIDYDLIQTASCMLVFGVCACWGAYVLAVKSQMFDKKRSVLAERHSEIYNTLKNLGGKIPGFTPEDMELSQEKGTWYTTAELPMAWEYLVYMLKKTHDIVPNPRCAWKRVNDNLPFRCITLNAGWEDRHASASGRADGTTTSVALDLLLEPLPAGGTAVHFTYCVSQFPYQHPMPPLIRETNRRLKYWCLHLSQNPNRAGLF